MEAMSRIVIFGWPGTGKSCLARALTAELPYNGCRRVISSDEFMHLGWSEASEALSLMFDAQGPWIIEGVAVTRALRKWRERNPGKPPPLDRIIRMRRQYRDIPPGAVSMGKGVDKVFAELEDWIKAHVAIEERE